MTKIEAANPPATIDDVQKLVQDSLETLRKIPFSTEIQAALNLLAPIGFRTVVQLEEDGRKKRGGAAASNWTHETGEILLYFEPLDSCSTQPSRSSAPPKAPSLAPPSIAAVPPASLPGIAPKATDVAAEQITQCCEALAEAEKAGRSFIALKWFRDEALAKSGLPWVTHPEERQRVVAAAIEGDLIRTNRIPNPRQPQFPTTTVSLNREKAGAPSRYRPITLRGEPLSETISRDRSGN